MNHIVRLFPIFFCGSLVAITYKRLEETNINSFIKSNKYLNNGVFYISVIIFLTNLRSHFWIREIYHNEYQKRIFYAINWSVLILLLQIGNKNNLTQYLENAFILRSIGKYSYGMYLLHKIVIYFIELKFYSKEKQTSNHELDKFVMVTIFSYFVGYFYFHLVENNCMKISKKLINHINSKFSLQTITIDQKG